MLTSITSNRKKKFVEESKRSLTGDSDFDDLLERVIEIFKTKGVDYSKEGDRLSEFKESSSKFAISSRKVLGVMMEKHYRSVCKWIRGETLRGEPVTEKLADMIGYSLLAYKMMREEERSIIGEDLYEEA